MNRIPALFLIAVSLQAQTAAPAQPCAAGVNYNYFGETGVTFGIGSAPATTTGFGLRVGCTNAFSVTDIDSTIGAPLSAYSTVRTGVEWIVAAWRYWTITALAAAGATTTALASFAGGAGFEFDIGKRLTRGKFSVLADAQFRITGVPNAPVNAVAKSAGLMFRKTF